MREELRVPLGLPLKGEELLRAIMGYEPLVTVGDYCSADLMGRGVVPDIAIVDLKTKRQEESRYLEVFARWEGERRRVQNPPAHITQELWDAIDEAFKSEKRVLIEVQGEEDLAALPCIALAPSGAVVLYGYPDRGAVVVPVDDRARMRVIGLMGRMEHGD
jgi:hypothetical protein